MLCTVNMLRNYLFDYAGGVTCECNSGYRLSSGGHNCQDINECAEVAHVCDGGQCVNTDGSHRCICPDGFRLAGDNSRCLGEAKVTHIRIW